MAARCSRAASWAAGCARRSPASSRPFPGLHQTQAPFAERLVGILLRGGAGEAYDVRTAEELYGDFTGCFLANDWKEPRLRVGRHVVLRAAALA